MSRRFSVGDLVWAKAEGFPFWPGRIASKAVEDELKTFKNHEGKAVLFFGEELTYSLVEEKSIKPFTKSTDIKYTGPADLKEEFKIAVKMALENKDFEEPPLELNEEERMLKQVKYDIMREASDINTSAEDSIAEDKKQEVENKNEEVVEDNKQEVENKNEEVVEDNKQEVEDKNDDSLAEQKNEENLDSAKNQENAAEENKEESFANEVNTKTNICDSHTMKVEITSFKASETEFSCVEKKHEEDKSIDSLSPVVDVNCSESTKDEKKAETENVDNFKSVDVQEDERKDNLSNSQNIVVPQVSMNPVEAVQEANVKDKKKKKV